MQILIYKTELMAVRSPNWLMPNDVVSLVAESDVTIGAYVDRPPALLGLISRRPLRIGILGASARRMLSPALKNDLALRVRIVEVVPPHLSPTKQARVSISVWRASQTPSLARDSISLNAPISGSS